MSRLLSCLLVVALGPVAAFAAPLNPPGDVAACLMEGKTTFMGQKLEISDCIQNAGGTREQLRTACAQIADLAVQMRLPAPKTTWLAKCPASPQGRCLHMGGAPLTAYYYKRDDLPGVKASCEMMGGRYAAGG